jgi:TonB family protein
MRVMPVVTAITAVIGLQTCAPPHAPAPSLPPSAELVPDVTRVDEAPQPLVQTAPNYPDSLRRARVQGRVTFRFVLDTMGVPEAATFRIASSPDVGLSEAVQAVLPSWRYTPARLGGRKVRVLLEQWVDFAVR